MSGNTLVKIVRKEMIMRNSDSMRPYVLNSTNWSTVKKEKYQVAILPWGATEPHNLHLPYGTDTLQSADIAEGAAHIAWQNGARCMVLPAIPLGVQNPGQIELPFCLNTRPSTQKLIVEDILISLSSQSIDKLLIVNSHGGNDFKTIIRELQPQFPDVFIGVVDWFKLSECHAYFNEAGDHAGEMETSIMQYLYPGLVDLNQAGDGASSGFALEALRSKLFWTPRNWAKVSVDTGIGNPQKATPQKGEQCFEYIINRIAEGLIELASTNPQDIYEVR